MRNLVLRKRSRDRDYVCTTYFVPEEAYVFTLEGCDEKIEAIFRNAKGDPVAVLTPGESVTITRRGKYLICLEGRNALGSLWVEWVVPGSVGPTPSGENCCDELRQEITNIKNVINNLQTQIDNILNIINNLEDKDTITTITAGDNVTVTKNGNDYTISAQAAAVVNPINIVGGTNIEVNKSGDTYTINSTVQDTDTITTITAGDNITVSKNGNDYTISGQPGGVVNPITIVGGTNIEVEKVGDIYTINSTVVDTDTVTTITAGNNITVTKNGNDYTISSTGGSGGENAVIRSIDPNIIITER